MELHAGHHTVVQLLGLNVNIDTLMMTWIVAAIVIVVTLLATRGRALVPSGMQNGMEMIVEALLEQFKENLGPKYGQVTSVLLTMFLFIFFANEFGLLPNPGVLSSPTNDLNTTVNLMEEFTKPLTLSFRLFGNILAGEILMEVLYELVPVGVPLIWLVFSLVIGLIQAFIFTILTTSYLAPSFHGSH